MRISVMLRAVGLAAGVLLVACSDSAAPSSPTDADTVMAPFTDMTTQRYRGYTGGLYETGNAMPAAHQTAGAAHAKAIQPLDSAGRPSSAGRVVLLSIGMSNTTQEFCSPTANAAPCTSVSFTGQAMADRIRNAALVLQGLAGHFVLVPVGAALLT